MSPVVLLTVVLGVVLIAFVWVAFGVWVALDARSRGSSHPSLWAVVAPLSGVGLVYYPCWWRNRHERRMPRSRREWHAEVVAAGLGGFALAAVLSPPDLFTQLRYLPVAFVCCLPLSYWLTGRGSGAAPATS